MVHLSPQYANRYPGELGERLCDVGDEGCVLLDRRIGGGGRCAEAGADPRAAELYRQSKLEIVALYELVSRADVRFAFVTGQDKYRLDFGPGLPHVTFVDRNELARNCGRR